MFLQHFYYWLEIHSGTARGGPDPYYNFWSGFGSDLGELTIVTGIVMGLRHVNCHERGCWRLGHTVPESGIRACHKHHPTDPRKKRNGSVADMHEARK